MLNYNIEPLRILFADDDQNLLGHLVRRFRCEGYSISKCTDTVGFIDILYGYLPPSVSEGCDLIISDIGIAGRKGTETLEAASMSSDFPPMILLTPFSQDNGRASGPRNSARRLF